MDEQWKKIATWAMGAIDCNRYTSLSIPTVL